MVEKKRGKKPPAAKARPQRGKKAMAPRPARETAAEPKRMAEGKTKKVAKTAPVRKAPQPEPERLPFAGIQDLRPQSGATHNRKRVGRGPGSGHGKTAGRGNKGQKSRAGYRHQRGFEGGQMPLHRRVPKRGFTNIFRVEYDVVNLSDLERFEAGGNVTLENLVQNRLVHGKRPVKVLGGGQIGKALTVAAHKFSASARAQIEAAGGRCEVLLR
jgi:large subunit ribosomal protein L15